MRYALRSFRKNPLFTVVAVLSLGLGIGANTAIFTFTDQLLLRMLPVERPEELVQVRLAGGRVGSNNGDGVHTISHPLYLDLRDRNTVLSGLMLRCPTLLSIRSGDTTELVAAEMVSGNYFQVLGVPAAVGRLLTPDDDKVAGAHPIAVLSHRYWVERYGRDPKVIGQSLSINGQPFNIVGVSAEGFDGIDAGVSPGLRIPIMMKAVATPTWDELKNRRYAWAYAFGRLKPGVTREQAAASMEVLYKQIQREELQDPFFRNVSEFGRNRFLAQKFELIPAARGQSQFRDRMETPLKVLSVVVALVLLIACANVANLLLARAAARQKEIAVRFALGASRAQVVRQLFTESLILAGMGAFAGLLLSIWICAVLLRLLPVSTSNVVLSATPDLRVLAFTAAASLLTALVFGLTPAFQATREQPASTLKNESAAAMGSAAHVRTRKFLVGAQVGLALLLLVGAGLFARSLGNLRTLDPGFRTERLITLNVNPSLNGYAPPRRLQFFEGLLEQVRALPGVQGAAVATNRLLTGGRWDSSVTVQGYVAKQGEDVNPYMNAVSPGYFETLGIPLLAGRDFNRADSGADAKVVIVNQAFVKYFFPDGQALGKRVAMGNAPGTKPDLEIVGVVGDAKYTSLREAAPRQLFHPFMRFAERLGGMTVSIRTRQNPEVLFASVRQEVSKLDAAIPVYDMRTLEDQVSFSLATERLVATLSGGFSLLAAILAAVGLYGTLAYIVGSRTREIGIRMALGAGRPDVLRLVMREMVWVAGSGCLVGLITALLVTRVIRSQLYEVGALDPLTFVSATAGIASMALLASFLPAFRATRVQPVQALRYE